MELELSRRGFVGIVGAGALLGSAGALAGCSSQGSAASSSSNAAEAEAEVEVAETMDADVVVIGSGCSGLCAAVEAAQQGASVVVLEKGTVLGGSTPFAEGCFAAGSKLQKEMGIEGDIQTLLNAEYEFQNYNVNPKLWEMVAESSAENVDWLMECGVEFSTVAATGGDFAVWHVYGGGNHGQIVVDAMSEKAEEEGATILTEHEATKIVLEDGKVAGVQAKRGDKTYMQVSAPAVIIATGGFAASDEMIAELCPTDIDRLQRRGSDLNTGDGIELAQAAGAHTPTKATLCKIGTTVKGISLTNHITVAGAMDPMQLWVNQDGERFVNEFVATNYTRATNAILNQEQVYSFVDSTVLDKLRDEGAAYGAGAYVTPGTKLENIYADLQEQIEAGNEDIYTGDSIEEIADAMGLDADAVSKTLATYNAACEAGVDEERGKIASSLVPLTKAPFYGFRLSANLMNTMGGIKINDDCEVLDDENSPIIGLYAAGMECDGFSGETYGITLPGSDQGICIATGRITGRNAAAL